jgi:hypothetical protein
MAACRVSVLQVRAICWSANDSSIVSAGADGAVYEWRLSDFKRSKEHVLKGCQYRWAGQVVHSAAGTVVVSVCGCTASWLQKQPAWEFMRAL